MSGELADVLPAVVVLEGTIVLLDVADMLDADCNAELVGCACGVFCPATHPAHTSTAQLVAGRMVLECCSAGGGFPPHRMTERGPSFESVSTASDATLDGWDEEGGGALDAGDAHDWIALPVWGTRSSHDVVSRRERTGLARYLPHDLGSALVLLCVCFAIFGAIALLPWLSGYGPPSRARTTTAAGSTENVASTRADVVTMTVTTTLLAPTPLATTTHA